MTEREKLIELLNTVIFQRECADPAEVVADFLLDGGVRLPVLCRECVHCHMNLYLQKLVCGSMTNPNIVSADNFCKYGERRADNA